jgi:hypothetical protein
VRRFVIGALAAGAIAVPAAAPSAASAKACPSGFAHATIGGEQKCLHAGEYCAVRDEREYQRYHFKCVEDDGYRLKTD